MPSCQGCKTHVEDDHERKVLVGYNSKVLKFCCLHCLACWVEQTVEAEETALVPKTPCTVCEVPGKMPKKRTRKWGTKTKVRKRDKG